MTALEEKIVAKGNPVMVSKEQLIIGSQYIHTHAELYKVYCTPYVDTYIYKDDEDTYKLSYLEDDIISIEANSIIIKA